MFWVMRSSCLLSLLLAWNLFVPRIEADTDIYLLDVPAYQWFAGPASTMCGNLAGYWDRHGFPEFYTGPTGNGIAPLSNSGANAGVRSLWATKAGLDGRPGNKPGHLDDFWTTYLIPSGVSSFGSSAPDPYVTAVRTEHSPDCIADFIGESQRKWTNMNGECDGNLDGSAFVYWDLTGNKRTNFAPTTDSGAPVRDVQSGLKAWARSCGYDAEVFSQLVDFNPNVAPGKGFSFVDLQKEIDAGYPVLFWLQPTNQFSRAVNMGSANAMPRANPATS